MTTHEFNSKLIGLEGSLRGYARTLTRNEEDANDLVQETFLKVLENREKFNPSTNMKAWSCTIMKNTFINSYRRMKRCHEIVDNTEELYTIHLNSSSHLESPDSILRTEEIRNAIDGLNSEHRQSFQMYNEGYKYQEIADILELSIGTVKSRIFFGRKKLAESLRSYAC